MWREGIAGSGARRRGAPRAAAVALALIACPGAAGGAPSDAEYQVDRAGTLGPGDLLAPPQAERWQPLGGPRSFGSSAPAVWIRLRLDNPGPAPLPVRVTWDYPLAERLELWVVEPGGPRLAARGGLSEPPAGFTFRGHLHEAPLTLPPGARTVALLRAQTRAAAFAGVSVRSPAEVEAQRSRALLLYGAGAGLVLILAALALVQLAAFRDPAYLHYALFVLTYAGYAATMAGLGPLLLWPGAPRFALVAQPLFSGLTGLTGVLFARAYLQTRRRASSLDRPLLAVALGNLAAGLLAFLSVPAANLATAVLAALALALSISEGIRSLRGGPLRARWFVTGFGAFALFGVLFALTVLGAVPPYPELLWGLQGGFALTGVALAMALAERQLGESEERFRVAFETSPDAIAITRRSDGRYVAVNPAFSRITGFAPEEVVGRSSAEVGLWADAAERDRLYADLARAGAVHNLECAFRLKDGRGAAGLVSARFILLGGEEHLLSITREIGALKEAEAERGRLQDQLRQAQKLEAVGRLAGGVAHDFNNLLAVIRTNASVSLAELPEGDPSREAFQEIHGAATRAAALTRQLQAFGGRQVLEAERLDLSALVDGMRDGLRQLVGAGPEITFSLAAGLPPVLADRAQLQQAAANLAVNAREAAGRAGAIAFATRAAEVAPGHPERAPGRYAVLEVRDGGPGMSPEVRDRLFEPFFPTRLAAGGGGPGLGLAVVHGIARQHGGFVEVESEVGQGSAFRVFLPAAPPAPAQ